MQGAKNGDRVRINYIVKTGSGERIEANLAGIPREFTIGKDETIEGFEKGILDMKTGEIKTIHLSPDQAYGQREERKVFEMPKERLPKDFDPRMGQVIQMHRPDGSQFSATVIEYTEKGFKMDANHPLSGKDIVFDVELLAILS